MKNGASTDANGQRLIPQDSDAMLRILILGDSLSFGEGVDIKDRFDVRMLPYLPATRVTNTGTMATELTRSARYSKIGSSF